MAKDKERKAARILYVEQGKTAKEVADLVGVSEKTMSGVNGWVNRYAWKAARTANFTDKSKRVENIKDIIHEIASDKIAMQRELNKISKSDSENKAEEINQIRINLARLDDGAAKWTKTLKTIDKDSQITLSVYLSVMDKVFNHLQVFDAKLYMKTLEFQESHIHETSIKLG